MRKCWVGCLVMAAMAVGAGVCRGQSSTPAPGPSSANPHPATAPAKKKPVAARPTGKPAGTTEVIPLESAPPSPPPSPAAEAEQKAKDQRLLDEQKRQSEQAAQITNQQVDKAQKQQDSVQKEVRVQDAPGPAQTGVVPATGPPVVPASGDQRIQDAPGPAQTLPQPQPATVPAQTQPSNPPEV
jgi:hypothetical protein